MRDLRNMIRQEKAKDSHPILVRIGERQFISNLLLLISRSQVLRAVSTSSDVLYGISLSNKRKPVIQNSISAFVRAAIAVTNMPEADSALISLASWPWRSGT